MKLPTSWKEVTIKQFIKITDVFRTETTENFTEQDKIIHVVNIFLEDMKKDIMNLKGRDVLRLFKQLDFVHQPVDDPLKLSFKLKGQRFIVDERTQYMTTGQYADLKHFTAGKSQDDIIDNLHNIMAVICLPAKRSLFSWKAKPYEGDSHQERAQLFYNHLTIDIAYPLALFFYNLSNGLRGITLTSLEESIKETSRQITNSRDISGGGERTSLSTRLQQEIQQRKRRYFNGQ